MLAATAAASAQSLPASTAEDGAFLEPLALARARTILVEQVQGLALSADLTAGTWAARDVARERALRRWCRTRGAAGPTRYPTIGTCEIDIRVEAETLRAALLALPSEPSSGAHERPAPEVFAEAARRWPELCCTGVATLADRDAEFERKPAGWEDVALAGIQLAERAARSDALHALLDEAGQLKVTHARRLRAFLDSDSSVRREVLGYVERAADVNVRFDADQVAVAQARLLVADLIRILSDVHQRRPDDPEFHAADFREMALLTTQATLTATGLGIPPHRYVLASSVPPMGPTTSAAVTKPTLEETP